MFQALGSAFLTFTYEAIWIEGKVFLGQPPSQTKTEQTKQNKNKTHCKQNKQNPHTQTTQSSKSVQTQKSQKDHH